MTARAALRLSHSAAAIAKSQKSPNSHRMTRNPRFVINPAADIGEMRKYSWHNGRNGVQLKINHEETKRAKIFLALSSCSSFLRG
jgi:hypothetical protein